MQVIRSLKEWQALRLELGDDIGFVPTMGCLHEGHAELVRYAVKEHALSVVSIYVNPTQFNDTNDLDTYPRSEEVDCELLASLGVDYVLLPESEAMYPEGNTTTVTTKHEIAHCLEGQHRPGHFDGVLTVIMKLLWLVRPNMLYMGDKDYQQHVLVQSMIDAYHIPVSLHVVPTWREGSGLPLSSRLKRLDRQGLAKARFMSRCFHQVSSQKELDDFKKAMAEECINIEYLEERNGHLFLAAYIQSIRLIDHKLWENSDVD